MLAAWEGSQRVERRLDAGNTQTWWSLPRIWEGWFLLVGLAPRSALIFSAASGWGPLPDKNASWE